MVAFGPQPYPPWSSFYPRNREVFTEHALEVSYFFEVLRDAFYEEALIDGARLLASGNTLRLSQRREYAQNQYRVQGDLNGTALLLRRGSRNCVL